MDLFRRQSLILAPVPLGEVRFDAGHIGEPCQCAGLARPLHRADEYERERLLGEHRPHLFGKPPPVVGQGNVCRAGVLPAEAPRRLAVPDREDVHVHLLEDQMLSASVERTPAEAASCPHLQPVISGISSPKREMYRLWSISWSRIACLA